MSQTTVFKGTARHIVQDGAGKHFYYHATKIVSVRVNGTIILNSGGWRTATTKTAMNQASRQDALGLRVWQEKGEWFVNFKNQSIPFEDGMVLQRN